MGPKIGQAIDCGVPGPQPDGPRYETPEKGRYVCCHRYCPTGTASVSAEGGQALRLVRDFCLLGTWMVFRLAFMYLPGQMQ